MCISFESHLSVEAKFMHVGPSVEATVKVQEVIVKLTVSQVCKSVLISWGLQWARRAQSLEVLWARRI